MKLANIRILSPNTLLDPTLAEFVEKVALARPNLMFIFNNTGVVGKMTLAGEPAPSGMVFARNLTVTQDDIHVGSVVIERCYSRRTGARAWRIGVTSKLVGSTGRNETTYSSNMGTAIRNAKKFLIKPEFGEFMYEHGTKTLRSFTSAVHKLEADILRGRLIPDVAGMQLLLNSYLRGQEPYAAVHDKFRSLFFSQKYETALSEFLLAQHMQHLPEGLIYIRLMPEGLYAFFTGNELLGPEEAAAKANVQLVPFEGLPIEWQNKVAVLQILGDTELVKDVGYRASESDFLIAK